MVYPQHADRAPEAALTGYLEEAAAQPAETDGKAAVSEDFEHLRWFDLPPVCVAPRG